MLMLLSCSSLATAQELAVGAGSAPPGGTAQIPIDFLNGANDQVVAMNFDILFNPADISAVDTSNCDGNLLSPGEVVCSLPAPGVVRVIAYSVDLLPLESTELGTVGFTVDSDTTASTIFLDINDATETFVMSDEFAISVPPASLLGGEISVTGGIGFLEVSPLSVNFGPVSVTDPLVCQPVSAANDDTVDSLIIKDVSLGGLPFSIQNDNCLGTLLDAGDSCSIDVCFEPTDPGLYSDTLTIVSDNNSVTVDLFGEGTDGINDSNLVVTPAVVEFDPVEVGAPGVCSVLEAGNTGQQSTLLVESVALASGAPFSRVATTCPGTELLPGGICTITLCFNPVQEGSFVDDLVVTSSANDVIVPISGDGVAPPPTGLVIDPMSFDFGPNEPADVPVCTDFTVTNENVDLEIDVTGIAFESGEDFTLGDSTCPGAVLAPGESCAITACFDRDEAGTAVDRLVVSGTDPEPVSAEAGLSGELQIPPELSVSPDAVDFGLHVQGFGNPSALIDIRNSAQAGAPDLILDRVELSADGTFDLFAGTCESGVALVAGGDGCTVTVRFSTAEIGTFDAELLVLTLDGLSASAELRGEVQALDATALDDRIVFRGPGGFDSVGLALDAVRGFSTASKTELMLGAPGDDAVYLISDVLLGLGAFADDPALLSDIAMADGSAGVRLEGESGESSACFSFGFGFGFSVAAISGGTGPAAIVADEDPIIAIGDPNHGGPGDLDQFNTRGAAYLLKGSRLVDQGTLGVDEWLAATEETPSAGLRLVRRASQGPCIGAGLAGLGDIDGDGYPDMVVQDSPLTISGDGVQNSYIVYGAADLFELDELDVENSPERVTRVVVPFNEGGFFTNLATVSAAGDFNGDGADDFVVTAPNARFFNMSAETLHAGAAFVMLGSTERLPAELIIPQMIDESTFGDDVRVIFGPEVTADGDETLIGIDTPRFGAAVDAAGDLNGDGKDDLVIGAGQAENAPGAVFVVYGGDGSAPILVDDLDAAAGRRLMPVASDDEFFGEAVRGVGDVTGDRINDVLIGAPLSNAVGSDGAEAIGTGRVYVASGAALASAPGETAADGLRRIDLDELLPASTLEEVRFGFALAGFGTDVTSDFGNDFAAAAFRGAATDGFNGGGWVFAITGDAPPPPRVDAVAPPVGTNLGGTLLSIEGADFADGATVDLISGDQSTPCTEVERVSSTLLTCIAPPAELGAVDVQVSNPEGQKDVLASGFTFVEVTSLAVDISESADDFGLAGRLVQIDITNEGDFDADALNLNVELSAPGQSIDSALNLLLDCGVTDDGVRCSSAAEPRWTCSIDGSLAQCTQASLRAATASRLLLLVNGDGPVPVRASVDAFNTDPADGEAELFQ
jgi:hypothetical protein